MNGDARVRIEAVKNSILSACFPRRSIRVHVVAHRARPQRAAGIGARVIEPDGRPTRETIDGFVAKVGGGLPQDHAGAEHYGQDIIAVGQSQGGYRFVEKPGADTLVGQGEPMDEKAVDVSPVKRGMRCMPDCAFAAPVAGRRDTNWWRGDGSSDHCTPMPARRPPSTR